MKKTRILLLLSIVAAVATISIRGQKNMKKLLNAEFAISNFYVDSVKEEKLVEDAIQGMLKKLDPHSTYTNTSETKELEEPLQGNFSGIGIQFNMKEDTLYVIQTIAGGPSEAVGILAGDRITTVNDTTIAGVKMKNSDIMKRLRGPKGTKVNVTVKRGGVKQPIAFRITRANIPLYSIDASYMIDDNTGYIRISRFAASTHDEFTKAVKELKAKGMKQIIIDLTDNGGGYLQTAADMANDFLERGQNIVFTKGNNSPRYDSDARGDGTLKDIKVVIMANQYSASASEILSGAIQDWDRGVIVGRRTFGKGLVQRPFKFEDGSMMRLTVARYYTPSGRCIQKPYESGDDSKYAMDIYTRYKDGELAHADSIHFNDSLRYTTLKNKRVIYGGGGIMPDVFVPLDTTEYTDYYRDIVAKGLLNQYVINYVDKNRKQLKKKYSDVEAFDASFMVDDEMMTALQKMGEKDSIKFDEEQYAKSRVLMQTVTKALIARDVFSDPSAYFIVMNRHNDIVKAAIEVINDDKRYQSLLHN